MKCVTKITGRPGLGLAILASVFLLFSLGTQAQSTVTNGLVAYWNMDGNLWDSAKDFHGTPRGATPLAYVDSKAGFGKALLLDGTNYVEITGGNSADNLTFVGGNVSIAGWFKVGAFDKSWQALVARGEGSSWRVARNSAGPELSYAGGLTDVVGLTPIDDGGWHHFAAISDNTGTLFGTALYIDGQLESTIEGTAALTRNSGNNVMIGENPDALGRQWVGEIDDIGIWNRVLTDTEITALYAGGAGKALSTLLPPTPAGDLTIVTQPASISVNQNSIAVFTVVATTTGSTAPIYQWRKNGVDIPNAFEASYATSFVTVADNGAKYSVKVSVPGKDLISNEATLTVTQDTVVPTVVSIRGDVTFTTVVVKYSEPVDSTAEAKANYALDKGVTVNSVARGDETTVKLAVSKMAVGTDYILTINGVKDNAGNSIAADTKVPLKSWIFYEGGVLHKLWENISSIAALQSDTRFPDSPTLYTLEPMWEYGPDGSNESGSNYGNQLVGWFTPARSGNYIFFTNSDDLSNLYLSTDEDPANKKLIAQEAGWSNARNWVAVGGGSSVLEDKRSDYFFNTEWPNGNTITLQAGKRYYMESIHNEGTGGDSVAATFIIEGEDDPVNGDAPKLTGSLIGTYLDPMGASITISQQPQSLTIGANATATFTVAATGSSAYGTNLVYQWQKAAAGSSSFADIPGARAVTYTTPLLAESNSGEQYRVVIKLPPLTEPSAAATVTVSGTAAPDPARGVVAYWNFDDNLEDWIKDFDGTARGANPIPFVAGKAGFGKAIKLDGIDQFVEITGGNENELEFPGGSMSIAGWFTVDTFDTDWQALIAKGEGTSWRVARRAATDAIAYAGGVGEGTADEPSVNDGAWHHFVAVSDSTGKEFGTALYIDGTRYGVQTALPVISANSSNVMIGENPGALNRQWAGSIDDIAIWNRVLLPEEIAQLYATGAGKPLGTFLPPPGGDEIVVTVSRSGGNLTIQWSPAGGTLETTGALGANAVWTAVGAANPATVTIGTGNAYYRVRK